MPHLALLVFPEIDPVALAIGPFAIRWYALAYLGGLLLGWWLCRRICAVPRLWGGAPPIAPADIDDLVTWIAVGVVLGGRLGYVLFYNGLFYLSHPLDALAVWHGGMSFHGGFLGAVVAMLLFARARGLPVLSLLDVTAAVTPIGLFLGRLANFINGELFGRVSDSPLAMVFPDGGPLPRHPSQLYEAALEGIALFAILQLLVFSGGLRRPGLIGGAFVAGYAVARTICEQFREPDAQLGFLPGGITMGALLSAPMAVVGVAAVVVALRRRARDDLRRVPSEIGSVGSGLDAVASRRNDEPGGFE